MSLVDFLNACPCNFFTVQWLENALREQGYQSLTESEPWKLSKGGKYFVSRNGTSLLAFRVPFGNFHSFMIGAAHDDSPCFKVKACGERHANGYTQVCVEPYGGMISSTWLDRPLSVAGRMMLRSEHGVRTQCVKVDRDLLLIPSVAIHMERAVNDGKKWNPAVDLQPLFAMDGTNGSLRDVVAQAAGVDVQDIVTMDLYLYNRMQATVWGKDGCFLSGPRIDDLGCVYGNFHGFLRAKMTEDAVPVLAVFDNEEVGSVTRQGAMSDFLWANLYRINEAVGGTMGDYLRRCAGSFMVSADNAHALHPNHPEWSDASHAPVLNGGIVIKHHAGQKYCTDGVTDALFRLLCEQVEVPYQIYYNRADLPGGSTLGNLSNTQVSIPGVDIGLPQLGMHSSYETTGVKDIEYLQRVMERFFASGFSEKDGTCAWRTLQEAQS